MTTTITPRIVNVNTKVQQAPQPNTLQQQGAIVSCGATTLATNASQYCETLAQALALLKPAIALSSITWASGEATATVTGSLGLEVGETFETVIAGAVPAGYNGAVTATVVSSTEFSYPLATSPGSETTPGTYLTPTGASVASEIETFFAQGSSVGVSLLELGAVTDWTTAVGLLSTYIAATSPQPYYAYLVPPDFDTGAAAALATLVGDYASPTSQTYFFITAAQANLAGYGAVKSVFAVVQNPNDPSVQAAAPFYSWIANSPGPASILAPMAFRFLFGLVPWKVAANQTAINDALTAYANVALTGAEGGISNTCLFRGTLLDGSQASFWYGVDWFRLQVAQRLAAAVINGSNTINPLLYDQNGINTLEAVSQAVASDAVAFGCVGSAVVAAVPFAQYVAMNPNDYGAGIYNGLSATVVGQNGFLQITFNLDVVTFQ